MGRLGIIGGSGIYHPENLTDVREEVVENPYGGPVVLKIGTYNHLEVVFLPRHGEKHHLPPHKINYRANMAALKKAGVSKAFATAAVGSLSPCMKPGELAFLDQFIDFTKKRENTYYDGVEGGVAHIDMTRPYCSRLRDLLVKAATDRQIPFHPEAVYVCTEGPRFETGAEIRMFRSWGADLVGMTNVPEVVLARELGICYSAIALVTNYGAGVTKGHLTQEEVFEVISTHGLRLHTVLTDAMHRVDPDEVCDCPKAIPLT